MCRQPLPGKCIRVQHHPCRMQCVILPSDGKIAMRIAGSSLWEGVTGTGVKGVTVGPNRSLVQERCKKICLAQGQIVGVGMYRSVLLV